MEYEKGKILEINKNICEYLENLDLSYAEMTDYFGIKVSKNTLRNLFHLYGIKHKTKRQRIEKYIYLNNDRSLTFLSNKLKVSRRLVAYVRKELKNMTVIYISLDEKGLFLKINGHAGYDVEGRDIVCASISSMSLLVVQCLAKLYDLDEYEETNGCLKAVINNNNLIKNINVRTLIETYIEDLQSLQEQYNRHLKVILE